MNAIARWWPWAGLLAILAGSLIQWHPYADAITLHSDDLGQFAVSREIAAGHWERLLAGQDIHVYPLFRLVRLYFDLHYPAHYAGMYWVAILAHLASTSLLFILCRRFMATSSGALLAAGLFAGHTLGGQNLYVKAHSTYVLGVPFVLGALYCFCRTGETGQRRWAVAGGFSLLTAAGLQSLLAALTMPGVLLGYYLLGRDPRSQDRSPDRTVWIACALPLAASIGLWHYACFSYLTAQYFGNAWPTASQILARLWEALWGTIRHLGFQIWQDSPGPAVLLAGALGLGGVLWLARGRPSSRWIITGLATAGLPLFAAVLTRGSLDYAEPRYCYQAFLPVAIAAGAAVDLALDASGGRRWIRLALGLAILAAAPFYYANQRRILLNVPASFWRQVGASSGVLLGWNSFLEQGADRARASSRVFRLPAFRIYPSLTAREFLAACHPRGLPGMIALLPEETRVEDCLNFWQEIQQVRRRPGPFDQVPLPASLRILSLKEEYPDAKTLVCRAGL